jgi:hypothetical protein
MGWLQESAGLVLGESGIGFDKHQNITRGASLICIYLDPTCKTYKSSIFLLGGKLVLMQG